MYKINSSKSLFYVLAVLNLFFPSFYSTVGSSGYVVLVLVNFIVFTLGMFTNIASLSFHRHDPVPFIFGLGLLSVCLSMTSGYLFFDVPMEYRDLFELHRPILFFLFYLSGLHFSKFIFLKFDYLILLSFFVFFVFAVLQIFRLNDLFLGLYTKLSNISSRRVSAPFFNPYDFAFVVSFYCFYFMHRLLSGSFIYLPLFILSVVLILFTQSKSVFVAVSLCVVFFSFFISKNYLSFFKGSVTKWKLRLFALVSVAILCIFFSIDFLHETFPYLFSTLLRVISGGEIGRSGSIRIEQFHTAVSLLDRNSVLYIFGHGPAKGLMEYVESVYVYFVFRYGILGLLLYIWLLLIFLWRSFICYKFENLSLHNTSVFFAFSIFIVFIPIVSFGNNFTEQFRSSFFYYCLAGVVSGRYFLLRRERFVNEDSVY